MKMFASSRHRSRRYHRRGSALVFVILAVSVAVILGATFLGVCSVSRATAFVVSNSVQSRSVAESGAMMALAIISKDTSWRGGAVEGPWLVDVPYGSGRFTVSLYDGVDSNGDGTIESDGDLADSSADPVTIQSVGTVDGVSTMVSVTYMAGTSSRIAAVEKIELKDNAVIDSYNFGAAPYGPANRSQAAVISVNDTGKANVKFERGATIDGDFLFPAGSDALNAAFEKNQGTLTGSIGELGVDYVDLDAPEVPTMRGRARDRTIDKYTEVDDDLYVEKLKIEDDGILKVIGDVTIVATDSVEIKGQIVLDNPKFGNLSQSGGIEKRVDGIQIATAVTLSHEVQATSLAAYVSKDKKLRMAIYNDNRGRPGVLLAQTEQWTSTRNNPHWEEGVIQPVTLAPGRYWLAVSFEDRQQGYRYQKAWGGPDGTVHYRRYNARSNGFLNTWGRSDDSENRTASMYLSGNVEGQGATLTIFVTGKDVRIEDDALVNVNTRDHSRVKIYGVSADGDAQIDVKDDAVIYGELWTPGGKLEIKDDAQVYGLGRAGELVIDGDGQFHADTRGGTASPGLMIDDAIELNGGRVDSLDGGAAVLGCNSIGSAVIRLNRNAIVMGDAYSGPGGSRGVILGADALVTGQIGNLSQTVAMPLPTTPRILPNVRDEKINGGSRTISSSFTADKLEVSNNATVNITGDVTIVCTGDVKLDKQATIHIMPNSSLTLYAAKAVKVEDQAQINVGGDPAKFVIYAQTDKIELKNTCQVAATITAPSAEVKIKDDAQWYGSILARKIKVEKNGQIHYNASGSGSTIWSDTYGRVVRADQEVNDTPPGDEAADSGSSVGSGRTTGSPSSRWDHDDRYDRRHDRRRDRDRGQSPDDLLSNWHDRNRVRNSDDRERDGRDGDRHRHDNASGDNRTRDNHDNHDNRNNGQNDHDHNDDGERHSGGHDNDRGDSGHGNDGHEHSSSPRNSHNR